MRRTLEPCGTPAAYMRHKRRGEESCSACLEAWNRACAKRRPRAPIRNREQTAMDKVIAANPPTITWRKNSHGIWVHTSITDPHTDLGNGGPNRDKEACKWGHEFSEWNTIVKSNGTRECRTCKQRHNEARRRSRLLTAARSEL